MCSAVRTSCFACGAVNHESPRHRFHRRGAPRTMNRNARASKPNAALPFDRVADDVPPELKISPLAPGDAPAATLAPGVGAAMVAPTVAAGEASAPLPLGVPPVAAGAVVGHRN